MKNRHAQRGSALIVALLILIVMTVLGITAMGSSTMQEKMAGNNRDLALAFQAAEAALRDGERFYEDNVVALGAAFNGKEPGLFPEGANPPIFNAATWANSRVFNGAIEGAAEAPRYIIELIGNISEQNDDLNVQGFGEAAGIGNLTAVRVTARGVGGSANTVVFLQSNYAKRN
ncbi:MAG: hypothetical protein LBV36_02625 [Chromatiales bacterium]|jgi:type IV pilus assembly protein PilX|nr:hypothetical protein [Chromatiales bacterium]